MKRLVPLPCVVLLLAAAACGRAPITAAPPPLQGTAEVLSAQAAGPVIAPIDLATGKAGSVLPAGVVSPDGHRLYAVSNATLKVFDAVSGASLGGYPVPAAMALPRVRPDVPAGLSHNGRHLVLESDTSHAVRTSFWVVDVASGRSTSIALDGTFEYDGISDDGSALYLLQWLPNQPGRYSVRQYEVNTGVLEPYTLTDKTEGQSSMDGTRVASVFEPRGEWQYTLYMGGSTGAFIHALQVTGGFSVAWCIDLPRTDPATAQGWSIAMTPDGGTIYAANQTAGKLVTVHTHGGGKPTVDAITDITAGGNGLGGLAVLDGSRMYALGRTGVYAVDVKNPQNVAALLGGSRLRSLVMAPGGHTLLALDDTHQLLSVDLRSGAGHLVAASAGDPIAIVGVS